MDIAISIKILDEQGETLHDDVIVYGVEHFRIDSGYDLAEYVRT